MRLLSHIGEGMTLRAHVRAWIAAILDGSRDCRSLQQLLLLLLRALLSLPFERRVARPRARACRGEGGLSPVRSPSRGTYISRRDP